MPCNWHILLFLKSFLKLQTQSICSVSLFKGQRRFQLYRCWFFFVCVSFQPLSPEPLESFFALFILFTVHLAFFQLLLSFFFFWLFYLGALELTLESVFSLYFLQNSVNSLPLNSMTLFYIFISIWNSSCCYFYGSSETSFHHVAQTELKFVILLSQPPEYWEIRRAPPFLDNVEFVLGWYGDLKENVPRREGLYQEVTLLAWNICRCVLGGGSVTVGGRF